MMNKQINMFENNELLSINNIDNPAILRDIPFDKIYHAARKEASRKKPVFYVHKYFARRITCNFRMMLLGMLLPYEEDIWKYFYSSFENGVNGDVKVLDPFMGGGTTLFESCRLGCNTIGNDLQPLSNFVSRALISEIDEKKVKKYIKNLDKQVGKEIMKYYKTECPKCKKEADVMYNFHVKKVKTKSKCKEHRLFSGFVICQKKDELTLVCPKCDNVFKSKLESGYAQCACGYRIEEPKKGYVEKGKFHCPECEETNTISDYKEGEEYPFDTDIIAQEYYCPHCNTHDYKSVDNRDRELYEEAINRYEMLKDTLPIPQQQIPKGYNTNQIINHGYKYFKDLFNKRQLLGLGILLKAIDEVDDEDVKFWFQLAFSGMLEMNNMFCRYQHNASKISNIFFNHAYVPITMPVENNIWGTKLGTGNFKKTIDKILRGKKYNTHIYDIGSVDKNGKIDSIKIESNEVVETTPSNQMSDLRRNIPVLTCGDSRSLNHIKDKSIDIVLTDPPYGANIMYSELIDFFHVWNYQSSIGKKLGFNTPLSPKAEEIVVNRVQNKTYEDYKEGLTSVFTECNRVTKDNGFLVFSFHDKSLDSWISILKSIYASGFELVKSYPMHSESRTGAHTSNKNSIALDILLICKKRNENDKEIITEEIISNIKDETLRVTEDIIVRLQNVNAEITIPDIENIFISEYFSICNKYSIHEKVFDDLIIEDIKQGIDSLGEYFNEFDITTVRSGWWSKLYSNK